MADRDIRVLLQAKDELSATLGKVEQSLARTEQQAKATGDRVSSMGREMATSMIGFTSAAAAAAVAAHTFASALGDSIKAASDLRESQNKTNVVFGQSAKAVLDFANTAASALGQSKQEALGAAGAFGNMFNTVGLAKNVSAEMSITMVKLASDMASFNNQSPVEMLDKLRSGLSGEAEPLRQFGVLLSEAAVKAKGMEMGLADARGELTEAEKVQARYALILEQTAIQQGDFANTSGELANSQRILAAEFSNLQAEIGEGLIPVARLAVSVARDLIREARDLSSDLFGAGRGANAAAGGVAGLRASSLDAIPAVLGLRSAVSGLRFVLDGLRNSPGGNVDLAAIAANQGLGAVNKTVEQGLTPSSPMYAPGDLGEVPSSAYQPPPPPITTADIIGAAFRNAQGFGAAESLARGGDLVAATEALKALGVAEAEAANQAVAWLRAQEAMNASLAATAARAGGGGGGGGGAAAAVREEAGATADAVTQTVTAARAFDAWKASMQAGLAAGIISVGELADAYGAMGKTAEEAGRDILQMLSAIDQQQERAREEAEREADRLLADANRTNALRHKQAEEEQRFRREQEEELGRIRQQEGAEAVAAANRAATIISDRATAQFSHNQQQGMRMKLGDWKRDANGRIVIDTETGQQVWVDDGIWRGEWEPPKTTAEQQKEQEAWERNTFGATLKEQQALADRSAWILRGVERKAKEHADRLKALSDPNPILQKVQAAVQRAEFFGIPVGPDFVLSQLREFLPGDLAGASGRARAAIAAQQHAFGEAAITLGGQYGFGASALARMAGYSGDGLNDVLGRLAAALGSLGQWRIFMDGHEVGQVAGWDMTQSGMLASRFGVL